jgi:hypothetical protein
LQRWALKADSANHERILQELTRVSMEFGEYPIPHGAITELVAERDRYRAALERIAKQDYRLISAHAIAREALNGRGTSPQADTLNP